MRRDWLNFEVAMLASLALHVMAFGGSTLAGSSSLLQRLMKGPPPPAETTITFVEEPKIEPVRPARGHSEPARSFMETEDAQVTGEKPKEAEHYSDKATVAQNPENPTGKVADTPYLTGKETRAMSTEDVVPSAPSQRSVPASPPPVEVPTPRASPPVEKPKLPEPKPVAPEGFKVAQEIETPKPEKPATPPPAPASAASASERSRPGSRREVAAIKSHLSAVGTRYGGVAAFNVAESPFGAYDKEVIKAVQSRWYALIEQNQLYERSGTVELHFELHEDGTVSRPERKENSAGEILALFCEKAVVDSAPFAPLPEKLRMLVGREPREVNFTFYY